MIWFLTRKVVKAEREKRKAERSQSSAIKEQIKRYHELGDFEAPKLWINEDVKDFFKFDNSKELKDIKLIDYKHHGKISMPVAVWLV